MAAAHAAAVEAAADVVVVTVADAAVAMTGADGVTTKKAARS
jgi:hypothetical protein